MVKEKKRSPEREALAAAIEKKKEALKQRVADEAARDRTRSMVDAAERRLEMARAAVQALRDDRAAAISFAATTGVTVAPDTKMRDARIEEAEASDELDATKAALAVIEARLSPTTSEYNARNTDDPVALADFAVSDAASDVLRSELNIPALVKHADRLLDETAAALNTLASLASQDLIGREHWHLFTAANSNDRHDRSLPYVAIRGANGTSQRLEVRATLAVNTYRDWSSQEAAAEVDRLRKAFVSLQTNAEAEIAL